MSGDASEKNQPPKPSLPPLPAASRTRAAMKPLYASFIGNSRSRLIRLRVARTFSPVTGFVPSFW